LIGVRPKFDLSWLAPKGAGQTQALGTQQVYVNGQWVTAPRFARLELPVGHVVEGPAIFEQGDTTVWLEPKHQAHVDRLGNLIIKPTA
jgi:N-methylhydantoinase A